VEGRETENNRNVGKVVVGWLQELSISCEVMNGSCHLECGDATISATFLIHARSDEGLLVWELCSLDVCWIENNNTYVYRDTYTRLFVSRSYSKTPCLVPRQMPLKRLARSLNQ
jgi:hypothetical protein